MECLFCKIVSGDIPAWRIYEDDRAISFLDINPWQVGHSLVIPKRHSVDLLEDETVLDEISLAVARVGNKLKRALSASAINVVSNAGADAGQEVFHTHIHVIPRYREAPGLAQLKTTVTEDVEATWRKITG